jgi:hypothetical protein
MTSKSIQSPWTTTLLPLLRVCPPFQSFQLLYGIVHLFGFLFPLVILYGSRTLQYLRRKSVGRNPFRDIAFFLPTRSTCLSHPKSESSLKQNNQSAVFKLQFRLKSKIHYKDKLVTRERMNIKRFCIYLSMILQLRKWEEDENDSLIPSFLVYFYVKL